MADQIVELVCPMCRTHRFDKPRDAEDQLSSCPVCNHDASDLTPSGSRAEAANPMECGGK